MKCMFSIGNSLVSSVIWEKHAQVSLENNCTSQKDECNLCVFEKLISACFPNFHEKPYYYSILICT